MTLAAGVRAGAGRLRSAVDAMARPVERRVNMMARAALAQGIPSSRVIGTARAAESALTPEARARGGFFPEAAPARREAALQARPPTAVRRPGFVVGAAERDARGGFTRREPLPPRPLSPAVAGPGFVVRDTDDAARPGGFTARADVIGGTARARAGQRAAVRAHTIALRGATQATDGLGAASQRAGTTAARGMRVAATGAQRAGKAAQQAGGSFDDMMSAGNQRTLAIASMMSNVAGDARRLARALGEIANRAAAEATGVQTARAELTTVITSEHVFVGMTPEETVAEIQRRAQQAAAGKTVAGRLVGGFGTEQFLEGAFVAASSGIMGESITASVGQAALLAKAGQTTVRKAAVGLNQAYAIFGDQAALAGIADPVERMRATEAEWARLSDIIARTQDTFAFTGGLDQVFQGLSRSSAVAKSYGVSLEDLAVGVGVLNDAGITGAKAGQGMKMAIQNLPEAMRRLGLEIAPDRCRRHRPVRESAAHQGRRRRTRGDYKGVRQIRRFACPDAATESRRRSTAASESSAARRWKRGDRGRHLRRAAGESR